MNAIKHGNRMGRAKGQNQVGAGVVRPAVNDKTNVVNRSPSGKALKIIAMKQAHPDLSTREIGKQVGCSGVNVFTTLKRYGIDTAAVRDYTDNKTAVLNGIQEKLIKELSMRSFEKESVHTLVVDTGIIQSKLNEIASAKHGNNGVAVQINIISDPSKPPITISHSGGDAGVQDV